MFLRGAAFLVCLSALSSISPPLEAAGKRSPCASALAVPSFTSDASFEPEIITIEKLEYQKSKELTQMYVKEFDILSKEEFIKFVMEERPEGLSVSPKRDFPNEFEGWDLYLGLAGRTKPSGGAQKQKTFDDSLKRLFEKIYDDYDADYYDYETITRGGAEGDFHDESEPALRGGASDNSNDLEPPDEKRMFEPSLQREKEPRLKTGRAARSGASSSSVVSDANSDLRRRTEAGETASAAQAVQLNKEDWLSQNHFESLLTVLDIRTEAEYFRWTAQFGVRSVPVSPASRNNPGESVFPEDASESGRADRDKESFRQSDGKRLRAQPTEILLKTAEEKGGAADRMEQAPDKKIPRYPDRFYPNFSWRLHSEKMFQLKGGRQMKRAAVSAKEAPPLEVFESLALKAGVFRRTAYREWIQTEEAQKAAEPYQLPPNPEHRYPEFSFKEWAARNGQTTRAARVSSKNAPPLEVFESLALKARVFSARAYKKWRRTKEAQKAAEPYKLPYHPDRFYPGFSWKEHAAKAAGAVGRKI